MISRRNMLKTGGAALAGLAAIPSTWRHLEAISTATGEAQDPDLARYVDPFIGSGAHGHTFPGASVPFGMVQLSPDNGVNGWDWSSGYHWSSDRIAGFSHTHLSGTGIGDMYDVLFMPTVAAGPAPSNVSSIFSHDDERAEPGYYSVVLEDHGITAELTATERVGMHRYTFPRITRRAAASIVVDLGHSLNWDRPTETAIKIESPTLISGRRFSTGWARDQRLYFVASFSRPIAAHWLESDWTAANTRRELTGVTVRGTLSFNIRPGQRIVAKVGISPVSVDGARRNLQEEAPGWDFDAIRAAAKETWNQTLARIQLSAASEEAKLQLYTALYQALLAPQTFCDVNRAYRGPDGQVHELPSFTNYTVFSLWDTFRAEHPLLTLVQPERVDDLIQSMMAFYREGGLLPVWSLAGSETNTMIGYHSVPVILDAWSKGLTRIDPNEALEAMIKSATQDAEGLQYYRMPRPKPLREIRQAETTTNLTRVGEIDAGDLRSYIALVNGYSRSLSGDTIGYHSPHPGARQALLVRTEDGTQTMEWETEAVPEHAAGKPVTFVWLAGIDAGENRRSFDFYINGEPRLTFRGPRLIDKSFSASGPRGSRLTFRATHIDQYDDMFGYMFLTLPAGLAPGTKVRLGVRGEAAGSQDWYMTFEQPLSNQLVADNVYALTNDGGKLQQVARIDIAYFGPPAESNVQVGDASPVVTKLAFGHTRLILPAPLLREETAFPVKLMMGGVAAMETELRLRPVRPFGYIPADWENESVSKTLEYAYDDWCIARMAEELGETIDERDYDNRALYYRNVFDPGTGFMRGKLSDGTWKEPFSPRFSSHRQDEYTEGTAWQYSWFVPHDVQGLIDLMGGRDAFIVKLDELFDQSSEIEGTSASPDISGLIGQYAHGNEPSHHIAYLYCYAGAPWKTQERVRQITDTLYGTTPEGLPGNEDCGQMSAWYILSAIGFYPVNPAEGFYVIGTPHHEHVSIDVGQGKAFTVQAQGTSSTNKYIQSATLNGTPLERCYITHAEIAAGGRLVFTMGDVPNINWANDPSAAPPSMSRK
jgi:putative alpha-1,2-mannosidase